MPTSSNESKSNKPNSSGAIQWNPFEDPTPFNQMTEDHIYEAEFDALRDRPNGNLFESTIMVVSSWAKISIFIYSAPKANEISSPTGNSGNVFPTQELSSPISQASQTSSSSVSLNGGPPLEAPPPLPSQHSQEEKEEETSSEDPFASAPFSLPSGFRRASQKANRR